MSSQAPHPQKPKPRKAYKKPMLQKLGHMAQVTRKSGLSFDNQQPDRPKPGGGGG